MENETEVHPDCMQQLLKGFEKVKKSRITFNLDSGKPPSETEGANKRGNETECIQTLLQQLQKVLKRSENRVQS